MKSLPVRALTALALVSFASPGMAAVLNLTSISGVWQNTVTVGGGSASGEGTSAITFGNTSGTPSGYTFNAAATPQNNVASPFSLGEFIHNNFVIFGGSLLSADLSVSVSGTLDGTAFSLNPVFSFSHNETNNTAPCDPIGATICPDVVSIVNAQDLTEIVNVGGQNFTLTIEGFQVGGGIVTDFFTEENQSNSATLVASLSEPAPVPLPAAGWLLLAAFGAPAAARKMRDRKTAA